MVWLANQLVCLIIMLNFLIAVISQVYDAVVNEQRTVFYIMKSELNNEFYELSELWSKHKQFKYLVIQSSENNDDDEGNSNEGMLKAMKCQIS